MKYPYIALGSTIIVFSVTALALLYVQPSDEADLDIWIELAVESIPVFSFFLFAIVLSLVLQMKVMKYIERLLCVITILLIVSVQVLLFSLIYRMTGVIFEGGLIYPDVSDSLYFSVLIFSGSGLAEFLVPANMRYLVMYEAAIGFIFTPVVITAFFLLSGINSSDVDNDHSGLSIPSRFNWPMQRQVKYEGNEDINGS